MGYELWENLLPHSVSNLTFLKLFENLKKISVHMRNVVHNNYFMPFLFTVGMEYLLFLYMIVFGLFHVL